MNSKKSMTKVLLLIFIVTMSMSFLTSAAAATNSESEGSSILTADYGVQVWLHDVDDWSYIQSVKIVMTGVTDPIELSRKASSIIYEAPDGFDYQFDKITQIIVKTSDGDQIFAPACEHGILGWWSKKIYYHVWVAGPNPIQLTKTVAPAQVYAGATVTYTFTVSNNGKLPLKDVSLTDPMFGSTPIWTDDYMASGDSSGSIVVTATAPSPAAEALPYTVNNTATVTATQYKSCEHENYCEETGCYSQVSTDCGDSDCDGDCDECVDRTVTDTASASYQVIPTPVTPDPKLTLTKGVNVSQTTGGQPVVYTFVLTNTGNVALQDITLTDAMLQTAIDSAG
ncbi:MAG: DUF11 domain-containing protein, partial [Clostridiales bacterium]|nr:DUF11 domain-containing protein [Clostridiales bacterium]